MSTVRSPSAPQTIEVEAPATGETIREIPRTPPDEVAAMAARARRAQPTWEALGFRGRAKIFDAARKWMLANADRARDTICSETGKTQDDAQVEVSVAAQSFAFWAKRAKRYLADERSRSTSPLAFGRKVIVRRRPVGLVGVIGPWNYPLVNAFCDCVPALMAGNSVLMKPSRVTPLTGLLVAEMLEECETPGDVFQLVLGGSEVAEPLIDATDFVMFTGSTPTGQKVMERGAKTLTPVSLELGGKDPMIVCADANVERAANAAAYSGLNNSGQVCISTERVYVEAPVYDEFVRRLADVVEGVRQGPPAGLGEVEVGAITDPGQVEIIEAHVEDAKAKGATAVTGGRLAELPGRFFEPTVLVDCDHEMECMREESFGPVIPVMRVTDTEEAIRLANDSPYGLQANVFTRSSRKAKRIADRLECGAVCVNDAQVNYTVFDAPMGGWKSSGVGSRHGADGIRKYTRTQTLLMSGLPLKRELHMFPYSPGRSKLMGRVVRWLYGR